MDLPIQGASSSYEEYQVPPPIAGGEMEKLHRIVPAKVSLELVTERSNGLPLDIPVNTHVGSTLMLASPEAKQNLDEVEKHATSLKAEESAAALAGAVMLTMKPHDMR